VPVVSESTVEKGTELVERAQPRGCQRAGAQGASPAPADESNAASLPRAPDEELRERKAPLVEVGRHLRSMRGKREANIPH
jgi:hypothetical protein